ncbi:hypothetical protein TNCV_4530951 [Trichonephila clavipes]|nr:hypothetical protein TNCV_4530951 [Trichonephila clavipes]
MGVWRNFGNRATLASFMASSQPYGFFWKLREKSTNMTIYDPCGFLPKDPFVVSRSFEHNTGDSTIWHGSIPRMRENILRNGRSFLPVERTRLEGHPQWKDDLGRCQKSLDRFVVSRSFEHNTGDSTIWHGSIPRMRENILRNGRSFLPVERTRLEGCQVIYSQFGLAIHQNDHQARRRFVEWAQNEMAVVPDFHKRILFSDEAHFWLNGYVNKQNCRIWSEANPQVYVETPLHPEKLTV